MSDLWQCYLIGLGTGLAFAAIPISVLIKRLSRERERNHWGRWWERHQRQMRGRKQP